MLIFWHTGRVFIFLQGVVFFRYNILLVHLNHTLECNHGVIRDPLQQMKLESAIDPVFQDLFAVLSDVI